MIKHQTSIVAVALAVWAIFVVCCLRSVNVGLAFSGEVTDDIGLEVSRSDGGMEKLTAHCVGNKVSFALPLDASHFYFTLPHRDKPYLVKGICIFGFNVFSSDWIADSIAPRGDVYAAENAARKDGDPLYISSGTGHDELDYVRFFDLLPRLFRLARLCLALAPLALLGVFLVARFVVRRAKVVDRPVVFAGVLAVFSLLSLPNPIWASSPGLDSSWTWFLSHFAWSRVFGSEVVFTYGPLGFLLHPELTLSNALAGLGLSIAFVVSWAWLLWTVYSRVPNGRASAWLLLFTMLFPQMNLEWRLVVLACLLSALPLVLPLAGESSLRVTYSLALAGAFLAVNSLVKFTSLTAVLGTQVFCLVWLAFRDRMQALRRVRVFAVSFSVVFVALSSFLFSSAGDVVLWVKGSLATASGYNLCMIADKSWPELLVPFAIVAFCLLRCIGKDVGMKAFAAYLVASPFVFCTVKYAIVRQSSLPLMYGTVAILAMSVSVCPKMRRFAVGMGVAFYVISVAMVSPYVLSGMYSGSPLGLNPAGVVRTLQLGKSLAAARAETESNSGKCGIPGEWRSLIGGGTVLLAPSEMGPAMSHNTTFKAVPLPSLQLYSSCSPYLDARNTALLDSDNAPEWIIFGSEAVGCGHMINYPRFFSAIVAKYEVVSEDGSFLLMKRRSEDTIGVAMLQKAIGVASLKSVDVGEWLDCHGLEGVEISVQWPRTIFGKFCGVFLRSTMCYMNVRYDDGASCRFQFIPDNSASFPFRLDRIVYDDKDVASVLKGEGRRKPVAIMFEADCPSHFSKGVRVGVYDKLEERNAVTSAAAARQAKLPPLQSR